MNGVEELRRALAEYLTGHGLEAVCAWENERRKIPGKAVAAVSLRALRSAGSGFRDYLGERYNAASGTWEELYGQQIELTFGLDLSAASAGEVQAGLDELSSILAQGGPRGMVPLGFSAGETVFRAEDRRYVCPVQARFRVWAVASAGEEVSFLDFTVRGEPK